VPHTILVPLFGDLGDTLLAIPALQALRVRFPHARIVTLSKSIPAEIVERFELVDDAICAHKHLFDRPGALMRPGTFLALGALLVRIRRAQVDTVVLFHHLPTRWGALKFGVLSLASGAVERVGIDNGRGFFLTRAVRDRGFGARHEAEYFLEVARLLGADGPLRIEFPLTTVDLVSADKLLAGANGDHLIAIHPGTGAYGPGRRWPADRFADAARILAKNTDTRFVIVGSGEDRAACLAVSRMLGERALDLCERTSLGTLAAVLKRCILTLANDVGVAHLSASVGTPVVSVFGPSNHRAWRPLLGDVVRADLPCQPCFYRDFSTGDRFGCISRECLDQVTPGAVAEVALSLYRENVVTSAQV
jgi:ADP-heptose:LPS heptosyltransferase